MIPRRQRDSGDAGPARPWKAIIGGLLVAVSALGAWLWVHEPPPEAPHLYLSLLERLDQATVRWIGGDAPIAGVELVPGAAGPMIALPLQAPHDWSRAIPKGEGKLRTTSLVGWMLSIDLPTDRPDAVRLRLSGGSLPTWGWPQEPEPFGAFYSDGGFLGTGVYLALPEHVDPSSLQLEALFPPRADLLRDLLGPSDEDLDPAALVSRASLGGHQSKALQVPNRAAVEIPAQVPKGGKLVFRVTRRLYPWAESVRPTPLAVDLDSGEGWQQLTRIVAPDSSNAVGDRWSLTRVDLGRWEGQDVTLRFSVPESDGVGRVAHYVADPAIVAPRARRRRPNLLVIGIDGLRADLSPWEAGEESLTPNIAELAARGLAFTQARAAAPWTRASVASMFTGLTPLRHGVDNEDPSCRLPSVLPTLAEVLQSHGFATAMLSANPHLDPAFGLPEGFSDTWVQAGDGASLAEGVLAWLAERPYEPFFVFAFFMDTHVPWKDRAEYSDADLIEARTPVFSRIESAAERRRGGEADPTSRETAKLKALYSENVRYVDAQIGAILDGLRRLRLDRETVVVVTADHGEAFGEHGEFFHGWNVYDELSHVPLVAAGPGIPRRRRVDAPISLTELPTLLLHWAGVEEPLGDTSRGAEEILEGQPENEPILMSTRFRNHPSDALLQWPWKLIQTTDGIELYDLEADPAERHDRAAAEPDLARRLHRRLRRLMAREKARRLRPIATPDVRDRSAREALRELEALGYVDPTSTTSEEDSP